MECKEISTKLLSIVIPTYNMEKYLKNCIESFIYQGQMSEKIELLVINDGSSDHSKEIAEFYEKKYPDSIRVINKQNGGHGSTINVGIKEAKGKYFRVVDSDDWVDTNHFYQYIERLRDVDVDMICTPYTSIDEVSGQKVKFMYNTAGIKKNVVCNIDDFLKNGIVNMHTITYRTQILKDNNIQIDEKCFYVDTEYVIYTLRYISTCILMNYNVYMYRVNLTTQSCSDVGYIKHCKDHEKVTLHLLQFIKQARKEDISSCKKKYFLNFVLNLIKKQYRIYLLNGLWSKENKADLMVFDNKIKKTSQFIYRYIESEQYIAQLRKTKFKFLIIHKLKFKLFRRLGKYPGLDF